MTEKRYFKEDFYDEYAIKKEDIIIAIVDSGSNANKICDELNALHEENEQLRKEKECDKQIFTKKRLHELLQQTQKENEHIKQTIREAYETERTQLGHNVLKQLLEAIQ